MIEKTAGNKKKETSNIKGQMPGTNKFGSLKDAFKSVEETMGALHVDAAKKAKSRSRG